MLRKYGTVDNSGSQRIARTDGNVYVIESLALSQDNINGHAELNMYTIFGNVLKLYSKLNKF